MKEKCYFLINTRIVLFKNGVMTFGPPNKMLSTLLIGAHRLQDVTRSKIFFLNNL